MNENLFADEEEMKKADELAAKREREMKNRAFVGYKDARVCAACKYFIWERCECEVLAEYKELNFSVSEYGVCKKFEKEKRK
jgi:hypothetical protein